MARNNSVNNTSNLDDLWAFINPIIENAYHQQQVSRNLYMNMYSKIHHYCVSLPDSAHNRKSRSASIKNKNNGGVQLIGLKLYEKIKDFFENYIVALLSVSYDFLNY